MRLAALRRGLSRALGTVLEWLAAGAASLALAAVLCLLALLAAEGLGHFWPGPLWALEVEQGGGSEVLLGTLVARETVPVRQLREAGHELAVSAGELDRLLLSEGSRDGNPEAFRWLLESSILRRSRPPEAVVIERVDQGPLYGFPRTLTGSAGEPARVDDGSEFWAALDDAFEAVTRLQRTLADVEERVFAEHRDGREAGAAGSVLAALEQERELLRRSLNRYQLSLTLADGRLVVQPLAAVLRAYRPNAMTFAERLAIYGERVRDFLAGTPRASGSQEGVFPAIVGTVILVLLMAVLVTPIGVLAAVYLHEYARQGPLTRLVRIAVNNLAGVPSLVFGVFGLGFFVYVLGGELDELFFSERLPSPTFGTPGLLWAALTLALLTLPVVIVATEEGLARIPRSVREGSLALGATRAETLWRVVLPMASPAMMTGLVLAVARAAGEVAPLMLVGVVKLAPALPVSGEFPYLHLEQKFMHLGFHIYDIGFHSPNPDASRSLVYATAFLLVLIVFLLNLAAVLLRNRLREKYKTLET